VTTSAFAPVFPGWNVWQVWQVKDLPFSLSMIGVSPERQLRIWVEDELRLHSAADVADPLDLKGGQIEVIDSAPGLGTAMRKEDVPDGATYLVSGPADLKTVRFFNKAGQTQIAWPHDDSYLLDAVLQPTASNPATSGPAPTTIGQTVGNGVISPIGDVVGQIPWWIKVGAALAAVGYALSFIPGASRKVKRSGQRKS
jgi:hypothetical protein